MIDKIEWPILGMTLDEAAEVLRVDKRSVVKAIQEDGLPYRKVGRSYRISHNALEAWLASSNIEQIEQENMESDNEY